MKYNPDINKLRGIAVLLTIYEHINLIGGHGLMTLKHYLHGNGGVILFFVISGFVISGSLDETFRKSRNYVMALSFSGLNDSRVFFRNLSCGLLSVLASPSFSTKWARRMKSL